MSKKDSILKTPESVVLQPCPVFGWQVPDRVKHVTETAFEYVSAKALSDAVAAERERCAKIADEYALKRPLTHRNPGQLIRGRAEGEAAASVNIAAAIREG